MTKNALQAETLILGKGLAGLVAAARLKKLGGKNIVIVGRGHGGSTEIAALNAAMPASPHEDSPERHAADMVAAGYGLSDQSLLPPMCAVLPEAVHFLEEIGVKFAQENGFYKLRQTSGCSCPRSLCDTNGLVGKQILASLMAYLKDFATFVDGQAVHLLAENGAIAGAVVLTPQNRLLSVYSPFVLAAWGGAGDLFPNSTYTQDVDGSGLAVAYDSGLALLDLEFVEYEPMVTLFPLEAFGEPCPTAMLGEGAHLLNTDGERFLLKKRPQGEAGAAKTLINKAIGEELAAGKGTDKGGVYADLRHLSLETLRAYPWFYTRLLKAGRDVKKELLDVGPVAHSHSGGIEVNARCETAISGLYAVGEASGGYHGACRMGGNAAPQTLGTGFIAAGEIAGKTPPAVSGTAGMPEIAISPAVRQGVRSSVHAILNDGMGLVRTREGLTLALEKLAALRAEAASDVLAASRVTGAELLCTAALAREETRGTHNRGDFPESAPERFSLTLARRDGTSPAVGKKNRA